MLLIVLVLSTAVLVLDAMQYSNSAQWSASSRKPLRSTMGSPQFKQPSSTRKRTRSCGAPAIACAELLDFGCFWSLRVVHPLHTFQTGWAAKRTNPQDRIPVPKVGRVDR